MPHSLGARLAAAGTLALAASSFAHAQSPAQERPATLPTGLAAALIGHPNPGSDTARFVVGQAPPGFASAWLPPAPARVVGGVVRGPRDITVILAYPSTTRSEDAIASYTEFLLRSGWTDDLRGGGFMDMARLQRAIVCRDSTRIHIRPAQGASAGTFVGAHLQHGSSSTFSPCGLTQTLASPDELQFPPLWAPPGVRSFEGGGNGGLWSGNGPVGEVSTTRLTTAMSPDSIAAHYGAQLRAAGWTVGAPVTGDGISLISLETRTAIGTPWSGSLVVVSDGDSRDVELRMSRARGRR